MKKKTAVWITAAIMAVSAAIPAFAAGWDHDEYGYWYVFESNSYARSQVVEIDGVKYAFDQSAYMVKGWYNDNGNWYFFDLGTGAQVTGWLELEGKWYYLNPANGGIMQKSWMNQGTSRYYFDDNGVMQTGAFTVGGFYYFAEPDGNLRRNTIEKKNNITIRYDDEGKQWYKNEESTVNQLNGGDSWLPVLEDSMLLAQREEIKASNADYVEEVKYELYENYVKTVLGVSKSTARARRLETWKDKVNRRLSELYVSQEDIDSFIRQVTSGSYGESDDEYDYDDYDDDYYDYDD